MRKTNKKGFTIVELVIVIAVIAILAAVLIPTFASIIKKANESADIQAARQMNTALAAESITEKPETFYEVIEILSEAGFNSEKALKPATKHCAFYWYKPENLIVLAKYEDTAAQTLAMPSLVLPVSAAGSEESPVSILYPFPEDHTEKLINDIITAIEKFIAGDADSGIFNLESGKDFLNALNSGNITRVTGVTLDKTTLDMTINEEEPLTATLTPETPTFDGVIWSSSDDEVARFDATTGLVTARGDGTAIITVTTEDGGYKATCTVTVNHTHTEVTLGAVAPTCTETGLTEGKKCSECGEITVAQEIIPATGHNYTSVVTPPTCTEQGYTTHTCGVCEDSYKDTYVDALGHAEVSHEAKAPTCTEIGWDAYVTCSRCDYTTYAEKAALDHDKVSHEAKAPTCTEIGWDAYETCSRCDYTTYAEKAALGHNYTSVVVTPPNCTEQGYTTHTCGDCDYSYKDTYVDATGHSFGGWVTTTEATWAENGVQERECDNCDETETKAIEAKCNTGEISSLKDLQDALSAGNNELNLTLTKDIPINEAITIANGKDVTIDLDGKTLTIASDEEVACVTVYGTLKITNGNVVIECPEEDYGVCGICIGDPDGEVAGGELNLDGVNITGNREWNIENYGKTSITGSTITVKNGFGIASMGTVDIKESKLVAGGEATQIYCVGGTMDITDTEFYEEDPTHFEGYYFYAPIYVGGATATLNNVTVTTSNDAPNIDASNGCEVVINSGTFNGALVCTNDSTITLYGGTFCGVEFANITETSTGFFNNLGANIKQEGNAWVITVGHEHRYTTEVTEPTCTEQGYTTYTCACGHSSYEDDYVEALGHTDSDNDGDHICDRCNADNATEHTGGTATCTEQAVCSDCGAPYGSANGHSYTTVVTNPTCTNQGYTTHTCGVCGYSHKDTYVDATGHSFGEWNTTEEATCTENGVQERECNVCGATETRAINAPGHTYDKWGYDDDNHWKVCSSCDAPNPEKADHSYDYDDGKKCECGRVNAPTPTVYYDFDNGNAPGKFGNALNGNGMMMNEPYNITGDEFTVSFWIKLENWNGDELTIFTNQSASGVVGCRLSIYDTGNKVAFQFEAQGSGGRNDHDINNAVQIDIVEGEWCHVICTVNKTTGKVNFIFNTYTTDEIELYTVLTAGKDGITGISAIGQYADGTTGKFSDNAYLDDFRIFDGALTNDDIDALKAYYNSQN